MPSSKSSSELPNNPESDRGIDPGQEESDDDRLFDTQVPSAKLEHDFVPQDLESTESSDHLPELSPCPACQALVEYWQITCHRCGIVLSNRAAPPVVTDQVNEELSRWFSDWMRQGVAAFEDGQYGEAQACFREALARIKGLDHAMSKEIEVRKQLARTYEKLDKRAEATEQYHVLGKLTRRGHDDFEKRAREISTSTLDVLLKADAAAGYRLPEPSEARLVPLYCAGCKQLLMEAEVYGFRNGKTKSVRCFCCHEGMPLVRSDAKHFRALKNAPVMRSQRALLLQAAADLMENGRKRNTAAWLAFCLGWVGAHRFYLKEPGSGIIYILFSWTLLPWVVAIFEGINYCQMSRVTFNLHYNIEEVLARLPAQDEPKIDESRAEVFAMTEVSSEDDDDEREDEQAGPEAEER